MSAKSSLEDSKLQGKFSESLLTDQEREDFSYARERINILQQARRTSYGTNIEKIWLEADKDYAPHRLGTRGRRVIATDENKGWRGALVTLGGQSDWQSDISKSNPYVKIQTALAILVDQNPVGVFSPTAKKFQSTTELIRQLYQRSWEVAKSKHQLKLFVFNLAKYGWSVGRTYPLRISRKVKVVKSYDPETPSKTVYEEQEVVEYNDIFRETLDPWNCWIDDMARPNNQYSIRDWAWRKVYAWDAAIEEFGKFDNWKYVAPGGTTIDRIMAGRSVNSKQFREKKMVEIYFYENRLRDSFVVIANGVPVIVEPLPISDSRGNKKLSLWQSYWTLRDITSPYGIGIYEAIRFDQAFLDRIRNMTIDQLTLSIYKMFFFQGTQMLTETGDIRIAPGVGKQVLDPKGIKWLEVPGPGKDAWEGLQMFQKDLDESSGITDPLLGQITGKTAFEVAQAKESALKRLKEPLDNILDALEQEGYITVSLIDLLYSIPEVHKITDPQLIEDYLKEVKFDTDLYETYAEGIIAKVYPEFPLNLDKDEEGNLIATKDAKFFRIKPGALKWEGIVNIKPQSILSPSKQIDKALELEMFNILIPLLASPPEVYEKIAKEICKLYDKDPRDILPENWVNPPSQNPQEQPLIVPQQGLPANTAPPPSAPDQFQAVPTAPPERPQSLTGKIVSRLTRPTRAVGR